jgi:hypothetical protein
MWRNPLRQPCGMTKALEQPEWLADKRFATRW